MYECCLADLPPGRSAAVVRLCACGSMRRRLLDLGLVEGARVECVGRSPLGDPAAYIIRGAVIAIRCEDSRRIIVRTDI
ncbi:MAG: ferrous iron transport protein A [Oscillospiraceae bacterium]